MPAFLKTSAAIGTVEFTGLLIKFTIALGQHLAIPSQRVLTIPAFILKRSSLVIPGFLGTPAGITTRSIPVRALSSCGCPRNPRTLKHQRSKTIMFGIVLMSGLKPCLFVSYRKKLSPPKMYFSGSTSCPNRFEFQSFCIILAKNCIWKARGTLEIGLTLLGLNPGFIP